MIRKSRRIWKRSVSDHKMVWYSLCVLEVVIEDPVCSRHLSLVIVISSIPPSSTSPLLNGACSIFFFFLFHFCLFLCQSKQCRRQWQWDSELTATTYHQRRRSANCLWSLSVQCDCCQLHISSPGQTCQQSQVFSLEEQVSQVAGMICTQQCAFSGH